MGNAGYQNELEVDMLKDFEYRYKTESNDDGKDHVRFFHGIFYGVILGGIIWTLLIYALVLIF